MRSTKDHAPSASKYDQIDLSKAQWHKSSLSAGDGNCVEVAEVDGLVAVRDTKDRQRGALVFTADEWQSFIDSLRNKRS